MKNLEEKVNERLRELGKTKTDLAKDVGVSWNGLAKMISRGTFKTQHMLRISKFLDVDLNFFGLNNKTDSENVMANSDPDDLVTKVQMYQQIIATKDEVIRAKDEIITALKEQLKR